MSLPAADAAYLRERFATHQMAAETGMICVVIPLVASPGRSRQRCFRSPDSAQSRIPGCRARYVVVFPASPPV